MQLIFLSIYCSVRFTRVFIIYLHILWLKSASEIDSLVAVYDSDSDNREC